MPSEWVPELPAKRPNGADVVPQSRDNTYSSNTSSMITVYPKQMWVSELPLKHGKIGKIRIQMWIFGEIDAFRPSGARHCSRT